MKFIGLILVFYSLYLFWWVAHGFWLDMILALPLLSLGTRLLNETRAREQEAADFMATTIASVTNQEFISNQNLLDDLNGNKFFLYLRPFSSTNRFCVNPCRIEIFSLDLLKTTPFDDIERFVSEALKSFGSFVALGKPGEHWGAGRVNVDETEWQARVLSLSKAATLIVLLPSYRSGTLWEITKIIEFGYLDKTVFLMPPINDYFYKSNGESVEEEWVKTRAACLELGISLPEATFGGGCFRYRSGRLEMRTPMPINDFRHWKKVLKSLCPELKKKFQFSFIEKGKLGYAQEYYIVKRDGLTDLMQAAGTGNINRVKSLLAQGFDVNARSNIGSTALMYAAKNAHFDAVELLLKFGADTTIKTKMGNSASDFAQKAGHKDLARRLAASKDGRRTID